MIGQSFFSQIYLRLRQEMEPLNLVEISRSRLLHNYDHFQKIAPGQKIWPVLKSNAYGHGLTQVAAILNQRKFEYLVLDSYYEALKIRQVTSRPVLLIGPNHPANLPKIDYRRTTVSVQDKTTLEILSEINHPIKIHLKVNTGMNRQGIGLREIVGYLTEIKKHPQINLEGVFSHLADADNPDGSYTGLQLENFKTALKIINENGFNPRFAHLSATAGTVKIRDPRINAARLGIGLYGFNPLSEDDPSFGMLNDLQPALRLFSTLVKIQKINKGDKISYNGIYTAPENMPVGVIPFGYYEGLNRKLSNKGFVRYHDKFLPIIGRICMNMSLFSLENTRPSLFTPVEIISPDSSDKNSIVNMAKICEMIPYELLVKISESIRRKIVD